MTKSEEDWTLGIVFGILLSLFLALNRFWHSPLGGRVDMDTDRK